MLTIEILICATMNDMCVEYYSVRLNFIQLSYVRIRIFWTHFSCLKCIGNKEEQAKEEKKTDASCRLTVA